MTPLRVLVVNPILFHYRRGVFLALDRHPLVSVVFASDLGPLDGIAAMSPGELREHIALRTRSFLGVRWQSGLMRTLLTRRFDAVVFLGDARYASTWLGAVVSRCRGARVAFWTIGWHRPEKGSKRWTRLAFYRLAHLVMLYGQSGKRLGQEMGYPEDRLVVIGNSVEATPVVAEDEILELPPTSPGELWLGAVIRLNPVKRLDLLVEAAGVLRQRGVDARLLLVGEGPSRTELDRRASTLGVPTHFAGAAYAASTMRRIYDRLDITVVPAAIGLTGIQSLAHGVPVVSDNSPYTQMPEWEAIVPGVTGELYETGNVTALADAIERAAARVANDPEGTAESCRREVAQKWDATGHAGRIVNAISAHGV